MEILKTAAIIFIVVEHLGFLILEMFMWTKPLGLKVFGQSEPQAIASSVLAANQGLYNGFLAAGLIWGLTHSNEQFSVQIKLFFLGCVLLAGLYGGYSVGPKILFIQALPAALMIALLLFA